jgi:hypothetical protein
LFKQDAHKTLVKLITVVNFINIFCTRFSNKSAFLPKSFCQSQNITREKLHKAFTHKKRSSKMLMKLTPGVQFVSTALVTLAILAGNITIKGNTMQGRLHYF